MANTLSFLSSSYQILLYLCFSNTGAEFTVWHDCYSSVHCQGVVSGTNMLSLYNVSCVLQKLLSVSVIVYVLC